MMRSWPLFALFALLTLAGCRGMQAPIGVMIPEVSDETFEAVPQRGTPELWDAVWAVSHDDGRTRVGVLNHGDESLALRINLIRSARHTIRIQTFLWDHDECGRLVSWELIRAVRQRGVRVEIIADYFLSSQDLQRVAFFATVDPRITIKAFNPTANLLRPGAVRLLQAGILDFEKLNTRMHNKLMVIDDRVAITGGRNIANAYYDRELGLNFKDRDVVFVGRVVEDAAASFRLYWDSNLAVDVCALHDVADLIRRDAVPAFRTRGDFTLNHFFIDLERRAGDPHYVRGVFVDRLIDAERVEWVADGPPTHVRGAVAVEKNATNRLMSLFRAAEHRVLMQSPYIVLNAEIFEVLDTLRETNPAMRLVLSTNTLAATDAWPTYAANYTQKRIYTQDLGLTVWEFKPIPSDIHLMMNYGSLLHRRPTEEESRAPKRAEFKIQDPSGAIGAMRRRVHRATGKPIYLCLHGKSYVIDDRVAFVGSFNLEPRSMKINSEAGLIVHDRRFARSVARDIERDNLPRNSYLVAPRRYPLGPLNAVGALFHRFFDASPLDPWPLRHAVSFDLRDGAIPVRIGHPDFYDHWRDVGSFPLLHYLHEKRFKVQFFKTFGKVFHPLL